MPKNKKLIILGKAPVAGKAGVDAREDYPDCEVWTVGTHKIRHADRYYEFHGIEVPGRKMVRDVHTNVKQAASFLPLNNSICVMLMEAFYEGYEQVEILGSPMIARDEYMKQRAALAMCIGYVRGAGCLQVEWPEEPEKINYFERYQ